MPSITLSFLLSIVKGALALGGLVIVCLLLYYGLIKPVLRKYRGNKKETTETNLDKDELIKKKIKWVEDAMNKGYKRKQIRQALVNSKWSEEEIEEIVSIYNEKKAERRLENEKKERIEERDRRTFPNI